MMRGKRKRKSSKPSYHTPGTPSKKKKAGHEVDHVKLVVEPKPSTSGSKRGKLKRKSSGSSHDAPSTLSKKKKYGPKVGRDKPGVERKPGTSQAKPLKVCNVRRTRQVGIVAASLQDLRAKIRTGFRAAGNEFEIVLEEDCTRVEDDNYFQTLSDNTVLMVVSKGEQWTEGEDEEGLVEVDGAGPTSSTNRLDRVAKRIAKNPSVMAFLPKVDLEVVVDSDINRLQVLLCQSKEDAQFIQDACERRLNEMIQSEEARNLLKLYHRAKTKARNVNVAHVSGSPPSKAEVKSLAITVKAQTESQDWMQRLRPRLFDIFGKIPGQSQLYGVKSGIVQ
ncbi:uncharacterized protein LOC110979179 isoform X2 [Acanthaster planci]|uniref:Uncharacterized protein LOC110979179 isoform X2 n=1 Tax=Acanthaster planci TaxID=133434 RepID=A0A8B7YD28_ACAPL|nr:uncharacterized protein LOC110979179 isoform X2 [Acanthaster planci]